MPRWTEDDVVAVEIDDQVLGAAIGCCSIDARDSARRSWAWPCGAAAAVLIREPTMVLPVTRCGSGCARSDSTSGSSGIARRYLGCRRRASRTKSAAVKAFRRARRDRCCAARNWSSRRCIHHVSAWPPRESCEASCAVRRTRRGRCRARGPLRPRGSGRGWGWNTEHLGVDFRAADGKFPAAPGNANRPRSRARHEHAESAEYAGVAGVGANPVADLALKHRQDHTQSDHA